MLDLDQFSKYKRIDLSYGVSVRGGAPNGGWKAESFPTEKKTGDNQSQLKFAT